MFKIAWIYAKLAYTLYNKRQKFIHPLMHSFYLRKRGQLNVEFLTFLSMCDGETQQT